MSYTIKNKIFTKLHSFFALSLLATTLFISPQALASDLSSELIIGKTDTGSSIELSICVKSLSGPIYLTNVSNWFEFDNRELKAEDTILEKGLYGGSNGYSDLKWQKVNPGSSSSNSLEQYTLRLDYLGDGVTGGQTGIAMQTDKPELFGKVKFVKTGSGNTSPIISITRNKYMSLQSGATGINQKIIKVSGDCRNSTSILSESELPTKVSNYNLNNQAIYPSNLNQATPTLTPTVLPSVVQTPFLQNNTSNLDKNNIDIYNSVRTGGVTLFTSIVAVLVITLFVVNHIHLKNKKKIDYNFRNKTN